ncbi:hypothetical protein GGR50DRAFT_95800 [Xylaria sp. CBS 124048]|nr:hypothetical protein GGR50DRAFT_95800 [Xylaria sp. CBS 124048]
MALGRSWNKPTIAENRDSIRVKLQELENEANTMSQTLLDAKRVNDKQANPIAALKTESANFGPEFVVSEKHRRLNDDDNPARVVEMALKFEKMRTSEPKVRTSPFKNGDWRLCQDLQKLKDSLAQSETTRAQLVVENVRAVARLAELESEASKQQEQIQNLTQDFGGQKAAHEAALSEIDRLKGLMAKRSSSAETTIRDLRFKTEELEKRVESAATEMNNLNKANSDSKDHVLREKTERQGVQNKVERPRPAINKPKIHVGVTEGHAPFGKPEPPEADSKLKDLQALLKDGSARYAKLLVDLKREKAKSAEIAGRLEAFETETKSTIAKLTNNLKDVRAEAKGFSDSCDSIKVELEKTRSELAAANSESEKHAQELQLQTQGRLNAFKEAAKSTIAKFTDDIQDVRAGVKGNSHACDGTKTELEKTKQELERANTHCAKQADNTRIELEKIKREFQTANSPFTMRADSIKIELEKIRRELETANSQSAKQAQQPSTAAERTKELGGGKDALLEIIRIDHSAALSHLENEIRRLNEEIKGRDERLRQQTDSTDGLMKKLQHVLGLKAKLELKVQGLETEMAKLKAHVADEISSREHLEERLKSEALSHANTRQALANMTQRATTSSNQLSYANGQLSQQRNKLIQANGELEYEHNKARWVEAELNEKKNTLQELKTMVSNQRAKMRSLENASKHNNCVTKDTVEKVVGSYERLYDFAKRKGSRKSKKTVHKAHYPDSFGFADGKYFIKFRDEWF